MTLVSSLFDGYLSGPQTRIRYVKALDGVRGTALLLVFCYHLLGSNQIPGHRLLNLLLKIAGAGWIGVDLFFALSGFLITGILFDAVEGPNYLYNFYLRRACRIFPLYYGFIFLLFLIFTVGVPLDIAPLSLLPLYMQNTSLWWNNIHGGKVADACSHLWSLATEEQFYLVWPLVILLVRGRRKLLWLGLALVCAAPMVRTVLLAHGAGYEAVYKLIFCRMDALLSGGCLALMVRGGQRQVIRTYAPWAFFAALLGCFLIAWRAGNFNWEMNRSINQFGYTLLAVLASSLIAMALDEGSLVARVMRAKPLGFVGRYSFGLYVYQPLVSVLLGMGFADALHRQIHSPLVYRLALEFVVLVVTFCAAMLSFHYFEAPFLRLKETFVARPRRTAVPKPVLSRFRIAEN